MKIGNLSLSCCVMLQHPEPEQCPLCRGHCSGRFVTSVTGIINYIRKFLKRCTIINVVAGGVK